MLENVVFQKKRRKRGIFGIFDPFKKPQKWKLGQFLEYTPRNISNGVRKSKKAGSIAIGNQISRPENVEKNVIFVILVIFGIFDPFKKAQKWKLDQFLKSTPRNIPKSVRKSKKVGNIALGNQIGRPKNVKKR